MGAGLLMRDRENVGNLLREINIFPTYSPRICNILAIKYPPQHFIKELRINYLQIFNAQSIVYKKQLIRNICHIARKLRNKSYSARKK